MRIKNKEIKKILYVCEIFGIMVEDNLQNGVKLVQIWCYRLEIVRALE